MREYFMKTDRVGFSTWQPEDIQLATALWGNPDVTRFICASGVFAPSDITERLNKEIENQTLYHVQYWPIFILGTEDFAGCCGLRPHGKDEYEIGFHLRPAYWHMGLACESAKAVIEYAFSELRANKLFAGHNPKNEASRTLLLKLGFEYIGDEYYEPTGLYHPSYELPRK